MSLPWITVNSRLQNGIILINALTTNKFHLLLSHIISNGGELTFTEDELTKLMDSLKLDDARLQLLLQSISYIFKQSSKVLLKPTDLKKHLVDTLKLDQEKSEIFVKEWSSQIKTDLGDFENTKKLENISWELNLQTALNLGNQHALPNARISLDLCNVVHNDQKDKLILEMGKNDLVKLYNSLEAIQSKLDSINKK